MVDKKCKQKIQIKKEGNMIGSIIVAVLSFLGTCIGSLTGIKLIKYRIEQLEKR